MKCCHSCFSSAHLLLTYLTYFYLNHWFPVAISTSCQSHGFAPLQVREQYKWFQIMLAIFFTSWINIKMHEHVQAVQDSLSNTSFELNEFIVNVYINPLPKKQFRYMWLLNTIVNVDSENCTFQPKQKLSHILLTFNTMCSRAARWHLREELYWLAQWGQLKVIIFAFYNSQDGACFSWLIWGGTESLYGPAEVNNKHTYPEGIAQRQHLLHERCPHWAPFMILMK